MMVRATYCKNGHLITAASTRYDKSGRPICRACHIVGCKKWRRRAKLEDLLRKAMPYYDSEFRFSPNYADSLCMDKLLTKILEIADGKK